MGVFGVAGEHQKVLFNRKVFSGDESITVAGVPQAKSKNQRVDLWDSRA